MILLAGGFLTVAHGSRAASPRSERPVWGFLPTWDPNAVTSLREHFGQLSAVLPTGLTLAGRGRLVSDRVSRSVVAFARAHGLPVDPVLSNYDGGWQGAMADRVLRTPALARRLTTRLAGLATAAGWAGVNIDLEGLPGRDGGALVDFVARLDRELGAGGATSVDVPADPSPAYRLAALGRAADRIVLMTYDEHASPGAPGPIASPGWVTRAVRRAERAVPAGRLVVGIPGYAYDWSGRRPPRPLDVPAALQQARQAGALPRWSATAHAPWYATRIGGRRHVTWIADAVADAADLRTLGPHTPVALWHLGGEDQGLWPLLACHACAPAAVRTLAPPPQVHVTGTGDVVTATGGRPGWRAVAPGWRSERYAVLPTPYRIDRRGRTGRRVAITFDDGPSDWTPAVLRVLERMHVPATFFVIGQNAAAHPGLVQREVADGFLVGDHTFTHPDLTGAPAWRVRLEVAAAERTVEGITGRRPLLFRAPYAADSAPSDPAQVRPLLVAQSLGERVVGASADSQDYRRPGVGRIVRNALAGLAYGNVILFHDGGGDRSQTVVALPRVIRALRARGERIVSVAALMGVPAAAAMPAAGGPDLWLSRVVAWTAEAWYVGTPLVERVAIALLALLVLRALVVMVLAVRHRRRCASPPPGPLPEVTVVVPAYEEETVIGRTLDALCRQTLAPAEIVVVDDGSPDGTARAAERPGVRVLRQENAGKWAALNRGFAAARTDVVVAIDADTILDRHAVARLARWFTDPRVGAVSGTAKVGNRHTLVALWQHVEYTTAFNLDRRAYSDLNAITVVPGAIGAWRRAAVAEAGGYSGRTVAEDCDLTLTLRRRGWRIVHEPTAVAWTEAPETMGALARQRLRWTFGTLQALWLTRGALLRPREGALGMLALPHAWLSQILAWLLAPVVDLTVLVALLSGGGHTVLAWFAAATVIEMAAAWLAFRLEGERAWPVLLLPLQRFAYRQVMCWIVTRSWLRAARGLQLGWGKLRRTGAVTIGDGGKPA